MKKKVIIAVLAGCAVVCLSTVYFQHLQDRYTGMNLSTTYYAGISTK